MRRRSTFVLGGILLALLAYIYFAGDGNRRKGQGPGPGDEGGALIPALAVGSEKVTSFRWVSAVGEVSLVRSDSGRWMVEVSGRDVPCDPLEVKEILTIARQCRAIQVIPGSEVDAGRLGEFRLEPPSTTLTVTVSALSHSIDLGAMSVARDLAYARRSGETDVLLVDSSLTETLSATTAADLRQRRVIEWSVGDLRAVEIRQGGRVVLRASRKDLQYEWVASVPFDDYVDPLGMDSRLLPEIVGLPVERFVKDGADDEDLPEYGLTEPRYSIAVSRGGGAGRNILIGSRVPDAAGTAYVMEEGLPFVLSARVEPLEERLSALSADAGGLRDRNVTRLGETPLVRVAVRYPPAEDFEFVHEQGEWRLERPERQPLEAGDVTIWLDFMRDLPAVEFVDGGDPVALGLADPRGEIRFWAPGTTGEVEVLALLVGDVAADGRGVYVLRKGGKSPVLAPARLAALLRSGHFAVKGRWVLPADWGKLEPVGISQRVGAEERSHTFDGERWDSGADEAAVEAILLCLRRLTAQPWVGRAAGREEEFGFAPVPSVEVQVRLRDVTARGPEERLLGVMIGKETEVGYFARAIRDGRPDADVFLLPAADYRILARSVSRAR